jgi:cbb3-type cytochrome oxidase subunit 1
MPPLDNDPTAKDFLATWTILGAGFLAGLIIRKCCHMAVSNWFMPFSISKVPKNLF